MTKKSKKFKSLCRVHTQEHVAPQQLIKQQAFRIVNSLFLLNARAAKIALPARAVRRK
jgi:hypothetical protein